MRQEIGEGTTSRVFLAIRRSDRRKFACKVVDKRLLAQDWNVHGVDSTIRNMNRPSLARLSDADRADVLDAAGDVLERWGYGPEDSA